jgi:hypothetical protein
MIHGGNGEAKRQGGREMRRALNAEALRAQRKSEKDGGGWNIIDIRGVATYSYLLERLV